MEVPDPDTLPKNDNVNLQKGKPDEKKNSRKKSSSKGSGATLVWREVCVYATSGNQLTGSKLTRIINNSTGAIQPGILMAVMGASGAGKSTLLSALAHRQQVGTVVQGDVLINGRRVGPFMHKISGFVHQEDIFMDNLTVLEHLTFMAHLRLDRRISTKEKLVRISDLLEQAGLLTCAETRIRSAIDAKVLSGGERKRLAFATELLTDPVILFCDEPTTGLDSYSAQQIINTLHALASKGTTIMCTIHQPSSQLFAMFHNVFLLAEGRVAFMGSPEKALSFFASNGYPCPDTYNPADFLIGILSTDPTQEKACQRVAEHVCNSFAVSSMAKERDLLVNLELHKAETIGYPYDFETVRTLKPRWMITLLLLCYRTMLSVNRDRSIPIMRIFQKIAIAFLAGLCFAGSITLTQKGIQAVQGALFILISENTFHPMYSVLAYFPLRYPLFLREKRSGIYSTSQYYISHAISMIPALILEPFIFVVISYWIIGLRPTFYAFFMTVILVTLVLNTATACGIFFSMAFDSVPLAMAYLVPLDYIFMITSGIFIKITTIPVALGWLKYFSWMLYANEALSILQWENVQNITCIENKMNLPCLHTGQDVMEKYNFSFGNLHQNIGAMVGLYLLFHFLSYAFLRKRSQRLH